MMKQSPINFQFSESKVLVREKALLEELHEITHYDNPTEKKLNEVSSAVVEYYTGLHTEDSEIELKIDSLSRILRILLVFPVRYKMNISKIEKIYKKYSLINNATYHFFQFSDKPLQADLIDSFMYYIKGSSIEKLCTFFLYRLNPEYIKNNFAISIIETLTPEELYYGVSTGYYSMKTGSNDALIRLLLLANHDDIKISKPAKLFISQIESDGFYMNMGDYMLN